MMTEISTINYHVYGGDKETLEKAAEKVALDFFGEVANPMITFLGVEEEEVVSDERGRKVSINWRAEVRAVNAA